MTTRNMPAETVAGPARPAPPPKPVEEQPSHGGSFVRGSDGQLTLVAGPDHLMNKQEG